MLQNLPHEAAMTSSLTYSSNGQHLAAAHYNGVIRVWKTATWELLATLPGHEKDVWPVVAFSPDGRTLASASQDRNVKLWDIGAKDKRDADRLIRTLSEHPAGVAGVAFSSDGGRLLAACSDGTVKIWDVATGQETSSFRRQVERGGRPRFSPDARRLAWACLEGVVQVWDMATGRLEFALPSSQHFSRSVAFSPDSRRIALAGFDGTVQLRDGSTGRETLTINAHPSLVADVAFSPDGQQLASASYDHTVRLWDASPLTGDPQAAHCVTFMAHERQVNSVAFSPNGRWLASASWDRTVKLWELEKGSGVVSALPFNAVIEARRVARPESSKGVGQAKITPFQDSGRATQPGDITLRYTLRGHQDNVTGVAFSSDNRTLASAGWDDTVKLWDLQAPKGDSLTELRTIPLAARAGPIGFGPDGQLLAIGLVNGIAIYDTATGKEVPPFKRAPAGVPDLAFGPDGRLFSCGASDPTVKVWDVAKQEPIDVIRHYCNPNVTVAVSPDGQLIASAGRDQTEHTVKIWDAQKPHAELRTLKGHLHYVWKVAFSPDGRYLASGSWDSTVKLWDVRTGEEVRTLRGHAGFIQSLAFSPDGRRLASASGGEVKVWDATLWDDKAKQEP